MSDSSYKSRALSAILYIVLGYFAYSVADLCAKMLQNYYSVYQVLTVSGFWGLVLTAGWLYYKGGWKAFFPEQIGLHIVRALSILGTAFFMVSALKTLPLADFYGIVFMVPFMVMIMAVAFLGEKVGWRRWTAAIVGFTGVIILAGPQFENIGIGVIHAVLGALCAAVNIITLRRIRRGPLALYGVYPFLFIALFNIVGLWLSESYVPFVPETLPYLFIHGPIIVFGLIAISIGFARTPETSIVAPFLYTQIIWGVLFGWLFFAQLPTQTTWAGLTLVIGAGLYSLWREYRIAHHMG